jgi:hypothetical protein
MQRRLNSYRFLKRLAAFSVSAAVITASLDAAQPTTAQKRAVLTAQRAAAPKDRFRRLAPGIETTIPIDWDASEAVGVHDLVDVINRFPDLEWTPNHLPKTATLLEKSKQVNVRRTIWNLEFTFKPLRMIRVDVPQADGKFVSKQIWYMAYRVKNKGQHLVTRELAENEKVEVDTLKPGEKAEHEYLKGAHAVDRVDQPTGLPYQIRFYPQFILECPKLATPKAYRDRLVPVAVPVITRREDANRKFHNTVEISGQTLKVSTAKEDNSVWGVVTWEDVDPRADIFSIYIKGLTNAYRWQDKPDAIKPDSPLATGRTYTEKTLKLNFWRPGDEFDPNENEFRYGVPGELDYEWVWR